MQICRELAGFSYGQADLVRRAMSKKKHDVMEKERKNFVYGSLIPGQECNGCVKNGISEEAANAIFDEMSSFASYAFNKSHAAAYAYVAYQTAYLKCHYRSQFLAALLTSVLDNTDKVIEYSGECQRLGIRVLPPDINVSGGGFTVDGDAIRFGLNAVKNVGRHLIAATVAERQERPFRSLYDFCKRMHGCEINRRAVESLIKAGAFDNLEKTRRGMLESVEGILKSIETDARKNIAGQLDLFSQLEGEDSLDDYHIPMVDEYPGPELLRLEKEVSGLYLSGHPLDSYRETIEKVSSCKIIELTGESAKDYDGRRVDLVCALVKTKMMTTKSNTLMAFSTVEDLTGTMEILIFPKTLTECREALQDNAVVVVSGRVSVKEDEPAKLLADGVVPVEKFRPGRPAAARSTTAEQQKKTLYLRMPSQNCPQMGKFKSLAGILDGSMPVYIRFVDTGKMVAAPRNLWVQDHPLLFSELTRLLGVENVVVK